MVPQQASARFHIFFVAWIVLMLVGAVLSRGIKDPRLKQTLWPIWTLFIAAAFLGFTFYTQGYVSFWPVIPVLFIAYLNIKNQKYCLACGKSQFNRNPFQPASFCSHCGAPLP